MVFDDYGYLLPKRNLALKPADPRDSSRLFIFDTKKDTVRFDYFYNLDQYLPDNSFLVLNNTKVLPARVTMKKSTGGKVAVLFLVNEIKDQIVPVMVDRKIKIGKKLFFVNGDSVEILSQKEQIFYLKYNFSRTKLYQLLKKYGTMPIPPYLKKTSLSRSDLIRKYQTIFAKREGSAAAPTASLHFTDRVLKRIEKKGIKKYFVTLHVGLGTFAPISEENIKEKKLHEEYFEITSDTLQSINRLKQEGKKLIAVGTTVVRTFESEARRRYPESEKNLFSSLQKTNIFIFPPYNFKMVDILLTNFHLPKSSLMMLVEAFLQHKKTKRSLIELYNMAIKNDFRFYSFGDAMVIK